jgi:hypothetical protein
MPGRLDGGAASIGDAAANRRSPGVRRWRFISCRIDFRTAGLGGAQRSPFRIWHMTASLA